PKTTASTSPASSRSVTAGSATAPSARCASSRRRSTEPPRTVAPALRRWPTGAFGKGRHCRPFFVPRDSPCAARVRHEPAGEGLRAKRARGTLRVLARDDAARGQRPRRVVAQLGDLHRLARRAYERCLADGRPLAGAVPGADLPARPALAP